LDIAPIHSSTPQKSLRDRFADFDCRSVKGRFHSFQYPLIAAAEPVIVRLVDPADGAGLVDKQCGRNCHCLKDERRKANWDSADGGFWVPGLTERLVMFYPISSNGLQIRIAQKREV
jgi:hypothetical protein